MVNSIKLIQDPKHHFNYLRELTSNKQAVKLYKKLEKGIEFKPGINILIGENGCGKSTVINIIRHANRIEHSFVPKLNHLTITTINELNELFDSFEVKQDYRYTVFNLYRMFEDKDMIGSTDVLNSFDNTKLFIAGKEESKGQNVMGDISQLFNWMFSRQEECIPMLKYIRDIHNTGNFREFNNDSVTSISENDTSTKLMKSIQANQIDTEPPIYTILMDEPDQGLDISNLEEIYTIISYEKPQTQLIASIHNPVLIYRLSKLDYINIIEMSDGYLNKVKKFIEEE